MPEQNNRQSIVEGKKILYLITQSNYGGAQKYVLELARHFRHANTVRIAVGEAANHGRFFEEARSMGIEPIVLKSLQREISLVKAFDALLEIRKLLALEKPNILHSNSSMAGAIGACAAWLYGFDPLNQAIRVVYTVHGFVFNEPLPLGRKKMYVAIERLSTMWKSAIITVSQFDKDQGLRYRIAPSARMVVIHNGIDASRPCLSRNDARTALNLPKDAVSVGTVASLYKTKGIPYLVEAAAIVTQKNRNVTFIVIGDGPERRDIEERIRKLSLEKNIILLGHKERAEQYVRAFDIFVLPSVKEGFPYALLEAGLAGLPIVASRVGGIPEIIEHEKNGLLVPPANPQELANALLTLLGNEKLRTSYATSMSETVRKKFTLESMLQKTEDLYARLVMSPRAPVATHRAPVPPSERKE